MAEATPGHDSAGGDLEAYLKAVVEDQFAAHPAVARDNGDHSADGLVPPIGESAHRERLLELSRLQQRGRQFQGVTEPDRRLDLATASAIVDSEVFDLEVRRRSFRDPTSLLDSDSPLEIGSYLLRDYAPLPDRLDGLCRQLGQAEEWTEEALRTLEARLAAPLIQLALEGIEGNLTFLRDDVASLRHDLTDAQLRRRLETAIGQGEAALKRISGELERRRQPDYRDVALGGEGLRAMLQAQEGLDRSVASLRDQADAELLSLGEQREQLLVDAFQGRDIKAVRQELEQDHFTTATLIAGADGLLADLRAFVEEHAEVPIPDGPQCTVRATPGFLTAWVSAAYQSVGPLEQRPLPALYYVTTPQASWSDHDAEEWLRYMNRGTLKNTSVHEVYPGHHVQCLYGLGVRSDIRRFFWFPGFGEGWAHYSELLMVERGLGKADPLLRLAQNEDALLRACRFRTTVGIHAEGWEVEQGTQLFIDRIGVEELPARREAMRATFDPLYLVYTVGKLEILKWRQEWLESGRGDLRSFHRLVLSAGSPPLAALGLWLQSQ
ncbi:MAG TPA: DUF885 domain-containing protein [Candidatus Dormibacteraeota bacterium]